MILNTKTLHRKGRNIDFGLNLFFLLSFIWFVCLCVSFFLWPNSCDVIQYTKCGCGDIKNLLVYVNFFYHHLRLFNTHIIYVSCTMLIYTVSMLSNCLCIICVCLIYFFFIPLLWLSLSHSLVKRQLEVKL